MDIVEYSVDGQRMILISDEQGTVTVVDRRTDRPVGGVIPVLKGPFVDVVLLPDDRSLYLKTEGGKAQVVDLVTREATAVSHPNEASVQDFSPDGKSVAMFHPDGRWGVLRTEDLASEHHRWVLPLRRFNGPNEYLGLGWDTEGTIYTFGPGTIDLWEAHTLGHLGTLQVGAADQTPFATVLPDGHTLLITHPAGQVVTWDLRPQHLLDVACDLAGRNLTREEWSSLVGTRRYRETCPDVE